MQDIILKKGEVGFVSVLEVSDKNGLVDLSGKDIFLTAKKGSETPVIDLEPCDPDADQTANRGKATFTFDAITANVSVNKHGYDLEIKVVDISDGKVDYFPKRLEEPYAKLYVLESLS